MSPYRKTIAAVVAAVASILIAFNIDVSEEIQGAIVTLLTAASVFWVRND